MSWGEVETTVEDASKEFYVVADQLIIVFCNVWSAVLANKTKKMMTTNIDMTPPEAVE